MGHKWNTADTITALRVLLSLLLLLLPLYSGAFFITYTLAGLTDALDGWLARRMKTVSEFGSKLDSLADLLFYGVLLFRLFPVLWEILPISIWYAVALIFLVHLASYVTAAVKYHRFTALHTKLNRLTGFSVFLLPYIFAISNGIVYSWAICILALAAAWEELRIHQRSRS